ncbi:MAG: GH1 family beta-glucosidase [Mycobacteriales bacterium]
MSGLPALGYGVATSAYQIEGAVAEDGRGPSVWDVFTRQPGVVLDGTDGSVACDSYHRLDDDLVLLSALGVSAYRFSIAWPRVQPLGHGRIEPRGLDYYDRLVDGLLARGLRPFPTLYHWDLPQPLEDAGGWPVRDTAERFADYARAVAGRLGDRIDTWATHNEPWCTAFLGYAAGAFAPGRRDPHAAYAAAHHLLLSHALAGAALRAEVAGAQVGLVLNLAPVWLDRDGDPAAADHVDAVQNRLWLDPLTRGAYPELLASRALTPAGVALPEDLERIRGSVDWLGVNYYTPFRIGAAGSAGSGVGQDAGGYPGAPDFAFRPRGPLTTMGWEVEASGLEEVLRRVAEELPGLPLRVTENGAAFPDDARGPAGEVEDLDRIDYLRRHLAAVERVRAAGVPVLDYFAWSLLDNFEWAQGYTQTFGLVSVDPVTRQRTPKRSFSWYAGQARAGSAR